MNKKVIIIVAILVAAGIFYFGKGADAPSTDQTNTATTTAETPDEMTDENLEGTVYAVEKGSVTYAAQKEFFDKPTSVVEGKTEEVSGHLRIDEEANELFVNISIVPNFVSDQSHRDGVIKDLFNGNVTVKSDAISLEGFEDSLSVDVPLMVTINGKTESIEFNVDAKRDGDMITASGSGEMSFETFGIQTPSMINVYTVGDTLGLSFEITTSKK